VNAYLETGIQGKSAAFGTMAHTLNSIAPVDIDSGRFKYVLIRVVCEDPESKQESSKLIVRGYSWAAFHADIYEKIQEELESAGMDTECLGGGRILHDETKKTILVYGYSQVVFHLFFLYLLFLHFTLIN